MVALFKSLYRHYQLKHMGAILGANLLALVPFVAALVVPVLWASDQNAGIVALLAGFLVTGQVLALTGRTLDARFQKSPKIPLMKLWGQCWAEGLVEAGLLLGLFSLAFSSVPFYWSQGTWFAWVSLGTLSVGTFLILGGLPYYLPVRRREGLGVWASAGRAMRLMNARPGLALGLLGLGFLTVLATFTTLGLFPGFAGLAALHQGAYDTLVEKDPQTSDRQTASS